MCTMYMTSFITIAMTMSLVANSPFVSTTLQETPSVDFYFANVPIDRDETDLELLKVAVVEALSLFPNQSCVQLRESATQRSIIRVTITCPLNDQMRKLVSNGEFRESVSRLSGMPDLEVQGVMM